MTPIFLPHAVLDTVGVLADASTAVMEGQSRLRALRDRAVADGAHVMLLVWPTLEWVLLAVEVPKDAVIEDARQLVPNLLAHQAALEHMRSEARNGQNLTWLTLTRRNFKRH